MDWGDLKTWVGKNAPMLGAALGGPLGGMAGALVASALGVKDANPDAVKQAIQSGTLDGDHILALQKAEESFTIQMAALGYKNKEALAELEFQDRDSARNRQIQLKDSTPAILGYAITVGFFGILVYMLKFGLPSDPGSKDAMLMMLGALGAAWSHGVIGFFFGSSNEPSK